MSHWSRVFAAIVLFAMVGIELGGRFLLTILRGQEAKIDRTALVFSFFRAGHAHAGVLTILALVSFLLVDQTRSPESMKLAVRALFGAAPILVSGGFFGGGGTIKGDQPGKLINLVYAGALSLAAGLVLLGVELLRA